MKGTHSRALRLADKMRALPAGIPRELYDEAILHYFHANQIPAALMDLLFALLERNMKVFLCLAKD